MATGAGGLGSWRFLAAPRWGSSWSLAGIGKSFVHSRAKQQHSQSAGGGETELIKEGLGRGQWEGEPVCWGGHPPDPGFREHKLRCIGSCGAGILCSATMRSLCL